MICENIALSEWNEAVFMTAYVPSVPLFQTGSDSAKPHLRKSVLICPGGGFAGFNEREMETVALQFAANGYCAFVLNYSIGAGTALLPAPLLDIAKGIAAIKARSRMWDIDPDQILLCGFSTSAYAVAFYGSVWHENWLSEQTRLNSEQIKPSGILLGYPILDLAEFNNRIRETMPSYEVVAEMMMTALFGTPQPSDEQLILWHIADRVSEKSAPTQIWTFEDDPLISEESLEKYKAQLKAFQIPCQWEVFTGDAHGSGLDFSRDLIKRAQWFTKMLLP